MLCFAERQNTIQQFVFPRFFQLEKEGRSGMTLRHVFSLVVRETFARSSQRRDLYTGKNFKTEVQLMNRFIFFFYWTGVSICATY